MKEIRLSPNKHGQFFALVDDADFDWLNQWKWSINKGYAVRSIRTSFGIKQIKMHRLILGLTNPEILTDHKDHNRLNNQRNNLRSCNQQQNQFNSESKRGISKYKGVGFRKNRNSWYALFRVNGKHKRIHCKSEKEAAIVYNENVKKYYGEFAFLNTIDASVS